jgi:hypothetical protein
MIVSFFCTHRAIRNRASADFDRGGTVIAKRASRDETISTGSSAQRPEIASLSLTRKRQFVTADHTERFPGESRGPSIGSTSTGIDGSRLSPGKRFDGRLSSGGRSPACNDGWSEWRNLVGIRSRASSGKNSPAGVPAGPELEKIAPPGYRRGLSSGGIALLTRRESYWHYGAGSALTPINFVTNFMGPPQFGCPLW